MEKIFNQIRIKNSTFLWHKKGCLAFKMTAFHRNIPSVSQHLVSCRWFATDKLETSSFSEKKNIFKKYFLGRELERFQGSNKIALKIPLTRWWPTRRNDDHTHHRDDEKEGKQLTELRSARLLIAGHGNPSLTFRNAFNYDKKKLEHINPSLSLETVNFDYFPSAV